MTTLTSEGVMTSFTPDHGAMPARPGITVVANGRARSQLGSIFALQVGVVIVATLYLAREILIPITLAILLSFALAPVVNLLRRANLGRVPSVFVTVVLALAVISTIGGVLGSQITQLARNIPKYADTVEQKIDSVRHNTLDRVIDLADRISRERSPAAPQDEHATGPTQSNAQPARQGGEAPTSWANSILSSPLTVLRSFFSPVLSPLATLGIVLVVTIFVLVEKDDLRNRVIRLFGPTDLHRTTAAMEEAGEKLSRYFLTQISINVLFGLVITVGLYFVGVPNPILWGILSALLRFIPYVGSMICAVLPIALAAAVDPGWGMAAWTAALFLVLEVVAGQFIEPLAYGHSTGLSPLAVIIAAIFWSWLWGPIGLVLSMPLTLCLVVLGHYVERLDFLAVLLSDRPPLSPVESFYQRVLTGDPDEALDHAEGLLRDGELATYYDEIALLGMRLAANDAARGVLSAEQMDRVKSTISDLVSELEALKESDDENKKKSKTAVASAANFDDQKQDANIVEAPIVPTAARGTILCVAGRGPLDETASTMLAQLVKYAGLKARTAPFEAVTRRNIDNLDVGDVDLICISYLDITGTPSHLRYLMRRLKQKMPDVPIHVGVWPTDDRVIHDERLKMIIGAAYYSTSLTDALAAILTLGERGSTDERKSADERDRAIARS
jgi:predicted PurR-regulated permease PerM